MAKEFEYVAKKLDLTVSEFQEIFNDKRFYRFLHIPIQSGSNKILKKMKRHYKIEEVDTIFLKLKIFDELFGIGTDVTLFHTLITGQIRIK